MNFNDIFRGFYGGRVPNNRRRDDEVTPDIDDADNQDIFKEFGFFMYPPNGPRGFGHGSNHLDDEGDDDDDDGDGGGRHFPHGHGFPFSFDHEVNQMFRHFEEMFRNFGLADFPPLDVPSIEPPPTGEAEAASPRDQMLKEPEGVKTPSGRADGATPLPREPSSWFDELRRGRSSLFNPSALNEKPSSAKKEDADLDDVVRQGEMDRLFGSESHDQPRSHDQLRSHHQPGSGRPQIRSFSRSVSIQTIRRPDGTIETRRTEQDGKGNTTTTVTTNQGESAHPWGILAPRNGGVAPGERGALPGERGALPGDRGAMPGLGGFGGPSEREHTNDPMFHRFFGSWFKK